MNQGIVTLSAESLEIMLLRKERDAWRERATTYERVLKGVYEVLRDVAFAGAPRERAGIVSEGVGDCLDDNSTPIDEKIAKHLSELPPEAWG